MERPILKAVGTRVEELDTPALVVDLDALDGNVEAVHSRFRADGVGAKLRPYVEAHRCPAIAHRQLAAGGTTGGVGVASVGEGEVFTQYGIRDVLVVNEVAGAAKIGRLCALARMARVAVAVDDAGNARGLSEAASRAGVELGVVVSVSAGQLRSGVNSGEQAVELARAVDGLAGLEFVGVMCFDEPDFGAGADVIGAQSRERIEAALEARDMVERAGIAVGSVIVGGSHCYDVAAGVDGVTEVLAGAYALMDHRHRGLLPHLEPAARVMAAVSSLPEAGVAILDTGRKAMGEDFGFPVVAGNSGLRVASMSAEHGKLEWDDDADVGLALGDRVWLTPLDVGGCVNVYDYIQAIRGGRLEAVLDVAARGRYR